ncbi:MAG: hypothetical protein ACRCT1_09535 [Microcoleaceae cyanobacterium]
MKQPDRAHHEISDSNVAHNNTDTKIRLFLTTKPSHYRLKTSVFRSVYLRFQKNNSLMASRSREQPDRVVQEFLTILSQQ